MFPDIGSDLGVYSGLLTLGSNLCVPECETYFGLAGDLFDWSPLVVTCEQKKALTPNGRRESLGLFDPKPQGPSGARISDLLESSKPASFVSALAFSCSCLRNFAFSARSLAR